MYNSCENLFNILFLSRILNNLFLYKDKDK